MAWTGLGSALVLILAMVAMVATANVGSCDDAPGAECDTVFADFNSPDLQTTNDGTPLTTYDLGNASGLAVSDSQLTHGPPLSQAAGYLEARIAAPVTRIGAIVKFHSENSGAVGLISWADSMIATRKATPPNPIPNGSVHFAASNKSWSFGVWDSAAQQLHLLLYGSLALATDGTEYAFEVTRYGDTVTIRLPDGTTQATRDPRIAEWSGAWACWELYENDAAEVPATISSIWAAAAARP